MKTEDEWFAENVRRQREALGWKQADLAERVQALGLDGFRAATISRIEKGDRSVKLAEALRIASALRTSLGELASPMDDALADMSKATRQWRHVRGTVESAVRDFEDVRTALALEISRIEAALSGRERFPGDVLPTVDDRSGAEKALEDGRSCWKISASEVVRAVEEDIHGEEAARQWFEEQMSEPRNRRSDDQ